MGGVHVLNDHPAWLRGPVMQTSNSSPPPPSAWPRLSRASMTKRATAAQGLTLVP